MSKHRGEPIYPNTLYHKSNPLFRKAIELQGLQPMKGDSYSIYSPDEPPAIFFCTHQDYDSTYDDDVYRIDTGLCDNEFFVDKCVNGGVVTYSPIPLEAITLIYKGTGNSL